jgi:hypothetical protein
MPRRHVLRVGPSVSASDGQKIGRIDRANQHTHDDLTRLRRRKLVHLAKAKNHARRPKLTGYELLHQLLSLGTKKAPSCFEDHTLARTRSAIRLQAPDSGRTENHSKPFIRGDPNHGAVSIPRQSRGLYFGGPLKATERGRWCGPVYGS